MKALSIKQPWTLAIASGRKTIETRTRPTKYRGEILIVASKKPDTVQLRQAIKDTNGGISKLLEYGKAIAVANLIDCRPMTKADEEAAMCVIYNGAYSWVLEGVRMIKPFEVHGRLGIYTVDVKHCINCGCTDDDCSQCIEVQGEPCHWVSPGKCSRCFDEDGKPKESEAG